MVFEHNQRKQLIRIKLEAVLMDNTIVKVHPDGTGTRKKQSAGRQQILWGMDH